MGEDGRLQVMEGPRKTFPEFCQTTSLHGWHHIYGGHSRPGRIVWLGIVIASMAVASVFLTIALKDFVLNRAVVTTIDTTTASLQVPKQIYIMYLQFTC